MLAVGRVTIIHKAKKKLPELFLSLIDVLFINDTLGNAKVYINF